MLFGFHILIAVVIAVVIAAILLWVILPRHPSL